MPVSTAIPMEASSPLWVLRSVTYGDDHPLLSEFIKSIAGKELEVEIMEFISIETNRCIRKKFHDICSLREYLCHEVDDAQHLRALSIIKLSGELVKLLGAMYEMDYELWTSRFHSSDRDYFAAPLNERGSQHFSHFHLACVDFYRASAITPTSFSKNRKVNRTVRLMRFLDLNNKAQKPSNDHRIYVIRRVAGHLRWDGHLWTFLYFCEPFQGFEQSGYVHDIPGNSMPPLSQWVTNSINPDSPRDHFQRLAADGFGLVVKVLRDIKSSWKLLLGEMEEFLEDINETFEEDDFIEAAPYLHRQFILYIDFFQRQLFYHRRYVTYLTTHATNPDRYVVPTLFKADMSQENDALQVLDLRLKALRERTTTVLEMILSLSSIKQSRLSSEILLLQRQDAAISFKQGESVKRLTVLNMLYLPPSFVATVYGMNTRATQQTQIWTFVLVALFFTCLTMILARFRIGFRKKVLSTQIENDKCSTTTLSTENERWTFPYRLVRIDTRRLPL